MQDELKALQKRVGTAFVHVTHDQEEAMALADHCVVMNHGRIEDAGPPGARLCPPGHAASPPPSWARAPLLRGNRHRCARRRRPGLDRRSAIFRLAVDGAGRRPAACWRSRPEHLHLGRAAPRRSHLGDGEITEIMFQGSFKRVTALSLRDPTVRFEAKVPLRQEIAIGDSDRPSCDPADLIVTTR